MLLKIRLSFCLFVLLLPVSKVWGCNLIFSVSGPFPPYHMQKQDGSWHGFSIELFNRLATHVGCTFEIVNTPFTRTVELLSGGEIDAISNFTYTQDRAKFTNFVGPHTIEKIVVIAKTEFAPLLKNNQSLAEFPGLLGKTQGTFYGNEIESILSSSKLLQQRLIQITSNDSRIGMLLADRIDAVFEEEAVARTLYRNHVLDPEKYKITLKFAVHPVYFGFSKATVSIKLITRMRHAWTIMALAGEFTDIYNKFQLQLPHIADHPPIID